MTEDLLAKEREFHRMNKELDEKTKDLMKEMDLVLSNKGKITYNLSRVRQTRLSSAIASSTIEKSCESPFSMKDERMTSPQRVVRSPQILEKTTKHRDNSANDAALQLLKAKIEMLQSELRTIQLEYKKKCDSFVDLESENKKHEEARDKFHNQISTLKETIAKSESNRSNLQTKIHDQNTEIAALKKEVESLKKDLKSSNQQTVSCDLRLNRSLEDNDKLRNTLKISQLEEKELRDEIRKLQEEKRSAIRTLEKQRSELFQAFKKQMNLVDNLKKQKAYLEASREMQFIEDDFSKLLEWKADRV